SLTKLPSLADSLTATLRQAPHGAMLFDATATCSTEASAKELAADVKQLLEAGEQMLASHLAQAPPQVAAQMRVIGSNDVAALQQTQEDNRVVFHSDIKSGAAAMGSAVALILPAVQAAREAASRNSDANNLKQLALAILNYEDQNKRLPAQAICDAQGKPL